MNQLKNEVVIVGGGCSGVLVAINLLRNATQPLTISIIEKNTQLGHGLAYSTSCTDHFLNVPNQNMSALADDKDHFINWLKSKNLNADQFGFSIRANYALYLQDCLDDALSSVVLNNITLHVIHDEVINISQVSNRWRLDLKSGQKISTQQVVLALGVFLRKSNNSKYISNPWQINLNSLSRNASIGLIGSGLSTVDMLLWLKELGWQSKITVFARNGTMPHRHDINSFQQKLTIEWPAKIKLIELFKLFRYNLEKHVQLGRSWHSIVDSLRPYTQQIWQNWTEADRRKFLRHLSRRWDLHRHRIAPDVAEQISSLRQTGFFDLERKQINIQDIAALPYDYIIDCAGLVTDFTAIKDPLVQNLFEQQLVTVGPLGRGLRAKANGELSDNLYTLGFALHGELWESIAVPELRVQAKDVANAILHKI